MTAYRNTLWKTHGTDIASVVGCGLDRLNRAVSRAEVESALSYYHSNTQAIMHYTDGKRRPIGDSRQMIADHIGHEHHPAPTSQPEAPCAAALLVDDHNKPLMRPVDWLFLAALVAAWIVF